MHVVSFHTSSVKGTAFHFLAVHLKFYLLLRLPVVAANRRTRVVRYEEIPSAQGAMLGRLREERRTFAFAGANFVTENKCSTSPVVFQEHKVSASYDPLSHFGATITVDRCRLCAQSTLSLVDA